MTPVWEAHGWGRVPRHSSQTNTLPVAYLQTGGLEIVWRHVVERLGTISGLRVLGYILEGPMALDINNEADWQEAARIVGEQESPPAAPLRKTLRAPHGRPASP